MKPEGIVPRRAVVTNALLKTGWKKSISLDLCLCCTANGLDGNQYNRNSSPVKCRRLRLTWKTGQVEVRSALLRGSLRSKTCPGCCGLTGGLERGIMG